MSLDVMLQYQNSGREVLTSFDVFGSSFLSHERDDQEDTCYGQMDLAHISAMDV